MPFAHDIRRLAPFGLLLGSDIRRLPWGRFQQSQRQAVGNPIFSRIGSELLYYSILDRKRTCLHSSFAYELSWKCPYMLSYTNIVAIFLKTRQIERPVHCSLLCPDGDIKCFCEHLVRILHSKFLAQTGTLRVLVTQSSKYYICLRSNVLHNG